MSSHNILGHTLQVDTVQLYAEPEQSEQSLSEQNEYTVSSSVILNCIEFGLRMQDGFGSPLTSYYVQGSSPAVSRTASTSHSSDSSEAVTLDAILSNLEELEHFKVYLTFAYNLCHFLH